MALSSKERKDLKARAHHLKPVIRVGQKGITESLVLETEQALDIHELIKVHISGEDRDQCKLSGLELASQSHAEVVDHIGKTYILYRKQKKQA
ncbi:MAG: ribosome assembly RNA-binding protein YhbY [Zetaproteobacteria bacterium CG12_big_fil_rev_8_21_14_0_65_54_13]|nr:MAG: ribosome assembly RNA-binding protein YhbY [Zetaproteobacteria bacterium CG23_combo_of_CG06-09_8_20_14_all_54_7]PIW51254.1 MAG: ribosome assembly RNA-binding protein YhbY [Zetaproteobacteria bacterium CG12_big_fil_rev_8_21_14_0_65_54_13]PIX53552.1 MAG: ribosome assembly RNA-binding protein YhbY [Zetaproteobacteria bacterium CG_4_10_14_3_um_filter_54_28]PJA28363.1 MAG: ribosome assembly RNA-binding protein YhbY [Zetaproteobacteria bacterium CG_4_9_14_3_um_filter_54_145]